MKNFEEKSFGFGKKDLGSDTNTEIGPWFRFPIPKPGFGRTLASLHLDIFWQRFAKDL